MTFLFKSVILRKKNDENMLMGIEKYSRERVLAYIILLDGATGLRSVPCGHENIKSTYFCNAFA